MGGTSGRTLVLFALCGAAFAACRWLGAEEAVDSVPNNAGGRAGVEGVAPPAGAVWEVTHADIYAAQPFVAKDGMVYFASDKDGVTTNIYRKALQGVSITQVTHDSEHHEADPAVSPSGEYLAYAGESHGRWDIFVTRLSDPQHSTVRITPAQDAVENRHPTWSPDGQWLAYHSFNRKANEYHVYKVRLRFSGPMKTETPPLHDAWLPRTGDGLLPVAFRPDDSHDKTTPTRTFAVDVAEGPVDLGPGRNPVWRPYPRDGSTYQPLIAFEFVRQKAAQDTRIKTIWHMGENGQMRTALYERSAAVTPAWSPDGNYLVFATAGKAGEDGPALADDIYYMRLNGRAPVQVTNTTDEREFYPFWHEDSIVFQSAREDIERRQGQLKAVRLDLGR